MHYIIHNQTAQQIQTCYLLSHLNNYKTQYIMHSSAREYYQEHTGKWDARIVLSDILKMKPGDKLDIRLPRRTGKTNLCTWLCGYPAKGFDGLFIGFKNPMIIVPTRRQEIPGVNICIDNFRNYERLPGLNATMTAYDIIFLDECLVFARKQTRNLIRDCAPDVKIVSICSPSARTSRLKGFSCIEYSAKCAICRLDETSDKCLPYCDHCIPADRKDLPEGSVDPITVCLELDG